MNLKAVKGLVVAGLLGAASASMANTVKVSNTGEGSLRVAYKIAYADPDHPPVYGPTMHFPDQLNPGHTALIGFGMNDKEHQYQSATFIPVSINGHDIPNPYPNIVRSCAVKTTANRRHGDVSIDATVDANGHGHIDCSKDIG